MCNIVGCNGSLIAVNELISYCEKCGTIHHKFLSRTEYMKLVNNLKIPQKECEDEIKEHLIKISEKHNLEINI